MKKGTSLLLLNTKCMYKPAYARAELATCTSCIHIAFHIVLHKHLLFCTDFQHHFIQNAKVKSTSEIVANFMQIGDA